MCLGMMLDDGDNDDDEVEIGTGTEILASGSDETVKLIYIICCPCRTLLFSLSIARICLSLSHASALLV